MGMTARYVTVQFTSFAVALVATLVWLGFGLVSLGLALGFSLLAVSAVALYDVKTGRYAMQGQNLFQALTDDQLRECYDAYTLLERGGTCRDMLFYKLLTRYEDVAESGYALATSDLLSEISVRWARFETTAKRAG